MEETYTKDKESVGAELLHYINSLIEPLANESVDASKTDESVTQNEFGVGGRKSVSRVEKGNGSGQAWVVGVDAVEDLKDIIKLLKREIEGGVDSERHAITMLCEWSTVNTKLIPLWNISTDNIEIQSLVIQVLFWLTVPPDESWRSFHSKSMKCRAYLKNMQKVKFSLCSTPFWREILVLYRKLKEVVQSRGVLKEDRDRLRCLEEQIAILKEQDNEQEEEGVAEEGREAESRDLVDGSEESENNGRKMQRLERLEMIRDFRDEIIAINEKADKRCRQYKSRLGMIKGLLIQALKIQDPVVSESLANFGVRSVHLLLVSSLVRGGVLEIVQDDGKTLLGDQSGDRRAVGGGESSDTSPWRVLEYVYGLICNIQPIDFVNELFGMKSKLSESEIFKNSLVEKMKLIKKSSSSGFTSNSLMNRHSRFNPELARRRIKESNGGTTGHVVNSKRVSSQRVNKYRHDFDVDEIYEYIDIFIGAMQSAGGNAHSLEMYEYPTIEGTMGSVDGAVSSQSYGDVVQTMGEFLEGFFKSEFPVLMEEIFAILRSGSDKHTLWDVSRLISLMTWVLAYKRTVFIEVAKNEKDKDVIKEELTRLLMETRYLLDTRENMAIDFIYSTIKLHAREKLLKNKSHKVARIAIRCLNEQLKIIHLVSNSEEETIRSLGISLIAFIVRLDVLNCLSWILKHYTKTSHHPELFLYSIEASNRLIKLSTKLGGETLVRTRRRRRDRPIDMKGYNEEEESYECEDNAAGFNESYYAEKVKLMTLDEMMGDYCDGRVVSNLMLIVSNYSTNHSNINWHTARLARKIITTRPPGEVSSKEPFVQLFCGLFFQLSYFITFSQILSDKSFLSNSKSDKGAQDIVLLSRHVIHEFWKVARVNQFVFLELLFSKNSARGLGLADPERLKSIFTDYEEGIDAAIVDRMEATGGEDVFEARSFVKNKMTKEKQTALAWSKEDDEELLALYTQYEGNSKCISIIASLLPDMKTERSVKKRLRELGKLEPSDESNRMYQDEQEGGVSQVAVNADLISGIVGFRSVQPEEAVEGSLVFDSGVVLRELLDILEESSTTKEILDENLGRIPVEIPHSLPNSLMDDPSYKLIMSSIGLEEPKHDGDLWVVPKELTLEMYKANICFLREYSEKDTFELMDLLNNASGGLGGGRSCVDNLTFSVKGLRNTIQDFIEDSELSGEISQVLDDGCPVENGLLHLISSELRLIVDKNCHADHWQRTELDDIYFCLSQARLDSLGIRREFARVFGSPTMSKLLHLLGFKKSRISSDTEFMVHLDRGVAKESSEKDDGAKPGLFDDDLEESSVGDSLLRESSTEAWILDFEKLSLQEFRERSNLFREIVTKMVDVKARISEELRRSDTFSKKTISGVCLGVLHLRRGNGDSGFLRKVIDALHRYLLQQKQGGSDLSCAVISTHGCGEKDHVLRIMEPLMGRMDENGNWSIREFLESYTFDRIREFKELLSKLVDLEVGELRRFAERVIGRKLKISKENKRPVNRSNTGRRGETPSGGKKRKKREEDGQEESDQSEYEIEDVDLRLADETIIPYMIDEDDDKWRKDWENLEKKMQSVGTDDTLFGDQDEEFDGGWADRLPDQLFGDCE